LTVREKADLVELMKSLDEPQESIFAIPRLPH